MFWLDNPSGVPQKPAEKPVHSTTRLYFTEGGNGQAPSYPGEEWFNMVQEELLNVVAEANLTPAKADRTQLAKAIKAIIVAKVATTTDFGVVRKATDAEAKLGQAIGAMMDPKNVADYVKETLKQMFTGMAFPWPTATPPDGFIALTGQAINQATDPLLYARFGATAPDMRGYIVRGWDNGRGVDAGRSLLSEQGDAIRNITAGGANAMQSGGTAQPTGAFTSSGMNYPATGNTASGLNTAMLGGFDASRVVPTAAENRMKNTAWNYITLRG